MTAAPVAYWALSTSTVVHAQTPDLAASMKARGLTPQAGQSTSRVTTPRLADLGPLTSSPDGVRTPSTGDPNAPSVAMPALAVNIDGLSNATNGALSAPVAYWPDAIGDVGPSHYVQATNFAVQVFNKNGTAATSPVSLLSFMSNCPGTQPGKPIVQYDPLADRWLIGEITTYTYGVLQYQYLCLALSTTPDPTGNFNSNAILLSSLWTSGKPTLGVWRDGYYVSVTQYSDIYGSQAAGSGVYAIDRENLLWGDGTARYVYFDLSLSAYPEGLNHLMPSDVDGLTPPPTGSPATFAFLQTLDQGAPADGIRLFEFVPDFGRPYLSTFGETYTSAEAPLAINVVPTTNPPGSGDIEQPLPNGVGGTNALLESHTGVLSSRLQYRNSGSVESLVLAFTEAAYPSGAPGTFKAGVRYAQLTRGIGDSRYAVLEDGQRGEYVLNRWIPSAAADRAGNIAVSYSVTNAATYPGLRYSGRLSTDAPGSLGQGESTVVAGSGVQRVYTPWGEATSMTVDPIDGCTFWFTGPYYTQASQNSSAVGWLSRIGSFKFSQCIAASVGTLAGEVFNSTTPSYKLDNVRVLLSNGLESFTVGNGTYQRRLPAGTYTATVSRYGGYRTKVVTNVVITGGATTTLNIGLDPGPSLVANGATLLAEEISNGTVDPGEMVDLLLSISNFGSGPTSNLTATLLPMGGVVDIQSGNPTYGVLNNGGSSAQQVVFRADPRLACGTSMTVTLLVADGATSLGTLSYTVPMQNTTAVAQTQSFDGVTAPALPTAWIPVNDAGTAPAWVTTTNTPAAGANAVYANNPNTVSDRSLWSELFLPPSAARLTFRNKFDLETTSDGGLLEISIANGAWQDIIAAGGSWVEGGYTNALSWNATNPAVGRRAWTGNSVNNTYQQTTVQLPEAAIGKYVRFRFRIVTDGAGSGGLGWWIDSVQLVQSQCAQFANNLLRNHGFDDVNGSSFKWLKYSLPDASAMPWDVTGGVFRFYRATGGTQAVVFQESGLSLPADQSIYASFDLGNSMNVRRRISVLIHDSNFSDLTVCTFWLEPNQPLTTYQIVAASTKAWTNASLSFYAASSGQSGGGYYLLDNVLFRPVFRPYLAPRVTQCIDPNRSATAGATSGNLLTNGDFSAGSLAPWGLFGNIASQVSGGVFEFFKQPGTPAGVILQATNAGVANDQFLKVSFQLGNSSSVRQRVTVLLHDGNFADLAACTFWLPPLAPLSNHSMKAYATQAWTNATLSVYPATAGSAPTNQWLRLDNVTLVKDASAATGTDCVGI